MAVPNATVNPESAVVVEKRNNGVTMLVLATTDGSDRSLQALPHAARLASVAGAELLLLRVLDPRLDCAESRAPRLAEAAREVAATWTSELEGLAATLPVPTSVAVDIKPRHEDPAEAILRVASSRRARMICMATRGAGAFRRALLGSVATSILGKASLPILVTGEHIRPPRTDLPYHVIVTNDGSPASETILTPLRRVLGETQTERVRVTLLRIYAAALGDPPTDVALEECRRELAAFKRHAPRRFPLDQVVYELTRVRRVGLAISDAVRDSGADSVWMATHGHSLRRQVLLGSVALDVLGNAEVPVVLRHALDQ